MIGCAEIGPIPELDEDLILDIFTMLARAAAGNPALPKPYRGEGVCEIEFQSSAVRSAGETSLD